MGLLLLGRMYTSARARVDPQLHKRVVACAGAAELRVTQRKLATNFDAGNLDKWFKARDMAKMRKEIKVIVKQRGLTPRILAVFWLYGTAMADCMGLLWDCYGAAMGNAMGLPWGCYGAAMGLL